MKLRRTISLAGAAGLALTLGSTLAPANAAVADANAPCSLHLGSVTAAGAHTSRVITAGASPTVGAVRTTAGVYQPGQVKHTTTFSFVPKPVGDLRAGMTVFGGALYNTGYGTRANGDLDPNHPLVQRRVGGGWSDWRWIEQSVHKPAGSTQPLRSTLYAQNTGGTFHRWTKENGAWRSTGGIGGLTTMKSFTLISRSLTHDTFLANNRNGGLYTVRIPTSQPFSPQGTPVRTATWQGLDQLIAAPCGAAGTVLLGIDRDTKSAYLYTLGHASGTSTVIKGLGKVPGTFADPHYFRFAPDHDTLNG
ncbi:hypothetical protein GCM10009789_50620 [Kribbella sancticallisti]|uniref:Uncharacterized protein n=1 Tax=Kribbella sancticallisti TaxID=460087 RepID=A0ABN2DYF3_9ACTN